MRTGHETVGKLVALCETMNLRVGELSLDDFRERCGAVDEDVYDVLGTENAMRALITFGSGGRTSVQEQLERWSDLLTLDKE